MDHHRLPCNHRFDVTDLRALVRHGRAQAGMTFRVGSLYLWLGRLWCSKFAAASDRRARSPEGLAGAADVPNYYNDDPLFMFFEN